MLLKALYKYMVTLSYIVLLNFGLSTLAMAENTSKVRIAFMLSVGLESTWDKALADSVERLKADSSYDVDIEYTLKDGVYGDKAEAILRLLARSKKYDIIFSNTAHSDQLKRITKKYPDILWATVGSGNYITAPNHYTLFARSHEPAYLTGMLAAGMSKTGMIGAVAGYPNAETNEVLNAYILGAKAVNSSIAYKGIFIESWYDPPKATEATYALSSAGVDVVNQLSGEIYKACEKKNILCLSKFVDTSAKSPETVLTGTELKWEPGLKFVINEWLNYKNNSVAMDSSKHESKWFSMAEGGGDISPLNYHEDKVPEELKLKVAEAKEKIMSGELVIPINQETPVSD